MNFSTPRDDGPVREHPQGAPQRELRRSDKALGSSLKSSYDLIEQTHIPEQTLSDLELRPKSAHDTWIAAQSYPAVALHGNTRVQQIPPKNPRFDEDMKDHNDEYGRPGILNISGKVAESPLRRPIDADDGLSSEEKPLARPKNKGIDMEFQDIIATFAVDTSGSTRGLILDEEKAIVETISGGLSRDAATQATIISWNTNVDGIFPLSDIEYLRSVGCTYPSQLSYTPNSINTLDRSSAWFLLTDGQIDTLELMNFSNNLCREGLHGKPCIIILVGYKASRPALCNISVGLSVFSNCSDCLFLFHDADTTQAYIFQSKGRFNTLLPPGQRELVLDESTLWKSLPAFEYRQLFDLPIPVGETLRPDQIKLQNQQIINLSDVYAGNIDKSTTGQILENDDNLKTVLLASQLRGNDQKFQHWILQQRAELPKSWSSDRVDNGNSAERIMRELLGTGRIQDTGRYQGHQSSLRTAHQSNRAAFATRVIQKQERASARNVIVTDSMRRIYDVKKGWRSGTSSPSICSPVSPGGLRRRPACASSSSMQSDQVLFPLASEPQDSLKNSSKVDNFVFLDGFDQRSEDYFKDRCTVCGQENSLQALLLKIAPDITTQGFPEAGASQRLTYPLAMGAFPETDVLSSQVVCDACAHTMVECKLQFDNDGTCEEIIGAIPIMRTAFTNTHYSRRGYADSTLKALKKAFKARFASEDELVFLAILLEILDLPSDEDSNNTINKAAFRAAIKYLVRGVLLPYDLSRSIPGTPSGGSLGGDTAFSPKSQPLLDAIQSIKDDFFQSNSYLLRYPLPGFIVIIKTAVLEGTVQRPVEEQILWQRFLFHLIEKHCQATHNAVEELATAIGKLSDKTLLTFTPMDSNPCSALNVVTGTHLLSEEDLNEFQRLTSFDSINRRCSSVLSSFLVELQCQDTAMNTAIEIFNKIRTQSEVFNENCFQIHQPSTTL